MEGREAVFVSFEEWTRQRSLPSIGTNAGADRIPFQGWRHFKEAFAPEIVERAIRESEIPVARCTDPFGGSGTTALACQFLGVHPTSVEVNPYLADLIEAKLTAYNVDALIHDLGTVLRRSTRVDTYIDLIRDALPPTFIEPGVNGRWLFDEAIAGKIFALRAAIDELHNPSHARLFRVLLGGLLVEFSNVLINGKGRRYRRGWTQNRRDPAQVEAAFADAAANAIAEIDRFSARRTTSFELLRGDSRALLATSGTADLAIFSPPYPNSFDYTDVYNIELWVLGYLDDRSANQALRLQTLSSHVQINRKYPEAPKGSPKLDACLSKLDDVRATLWNRNIPEMIGAYFSEMLSIVRAVEKNLATGGSMWIVIGDSRYSEVGIESAEILAELAETSKLLVDRIDPFRQMRTSAQQGGREQLAESLLVFHRR